MIRLLIVEDDEKIARLLEILFENNGFEVTVAYSGTEGWSLFQQIKPDIAVLDLMLPGIDGFELLEKIRSVDEEVGVVVLTARGEVENRIRGLKKGADDYIPKPFHLDELLARVEAVAKRVKRTDLIAIGDVVFNSDARTLTFPDGRSVSLSEREQAVLSYLIGNEGHVVKREEIIEAVWNDSENISKNIADVYVKYIRDKLGEYGYVIRTVRGVGYVFKP